MAGKDLTTLKSYFETGDTPTEAQFIDLFDSLGFSSLGAISTPITLDKSGYYDVDTLAANREITFDNDVNHIEGRTKVYNAIGNGSFTFTITVNDTTLAYSGFTNGGALTAGVLHRFAFTYIGGYIQVDYSSKTLITQDLTAPVFSNVSVDNLTSTTADFNAQIDEAGTIYWAVFPTATSQQTKAVIEAGTGAVDFGSIATAGGTIETDGITGLTASTPYKVHYFARDSSSNESVATLTSEFTTSAVAVVRAINYGYLDNYATKNNAVYAVNIGAGDLARSWSFWIYPTNTNSNSGGYTNIFAVTNGSSGAGLGYECRWILADQNIFFYLASGTTNQLRYKSAINGVPYNTWTHVTITYDGSEAHTGIKCYINNSLDTPSLNDEVNTYTSCNNISSLRICKSYNTLNSNPFRISNFVFYSIEIDSTLRGNLYNGGSRAVNTFNLLSDTTFCYSCWDFQDDLTDRSSFSLDLTETGGGTPISYIDA